MNNLLSINASRIIFQLVRQGSGLVCCGHTLCSDQIAQSMYQWLSRLRSQRLKELYTLLKKVSWSLLYYPVQVKTSKNLLQKRAEVLS